MYCAALEAGMGDDTHVHGMRRRLDIPGDWREGNLALITALITIRESGWWDDFWQWRDERDRKRFGSEGRPLIFDHTPIRWESFPHRVTCETLHAP